MRQTEAQRSEDTYLRLHSDGKGFGCQVCLSLQDQRNSELAVPPGQKGRARIKPRLLRLCPHRRFGRVCTVPCAAGRLGAAHVHGPPPASPDLEHAFVQRVGSPECSGGGCCRRVAGLQGEAPASRPGARPLRLHLPTRGPQGQAWLSRLPCPLPFPSGCRSPSLSSLPGEPPGSKP